MRDRAFGVEIECGYNGPGLERSCSCECWCEDERQSMRRYGDPSEEDLASFQCDVCRYGCEGCGEGQDEDESSCEVAATLLKRNGFEDWLDGIHMDGSGVEIPSPVLKGPQGMRDLRNVMALLVSNGFYTGRADGLHVHHDAPEFDADRDLLAHTVELWEDNFDHITRFVAPERRGTSWAQSRREEGRGGNYDAFKKTKKIEDLPSWRTCAMNIRPITSPYRSHSPNIEIRLHEGTLDFRKAAAWIHFGQAFLHTAIRTYQRREIRVCADALDVLRMTNVRGNSRRALMEVAALN